MFNIKVRGEVTERDDCTYEGPNWTKLFPERAQLLPFLAKVGIGKPTISHSSSWHTFRIVAE